MTATKKTRIATISLAGCFGCHMSLLDIDLRLLQLIELVEFDRSPLTDVKRFQHRCDIGIIEGGCCNTDNVEVLKDFRKHCDVLIALGECAIMGGLPALRNDVPIAECLETAYMQVPTSRHNTIIPHHEALPKLLDKVYPCHHLVKIDHYIPGCPPGSEIIWKTIRNLVLGQNQSINYEDLKYD